MKHVAKKKKKAASNKREVYVVRADLKRAKAARAAAPFTITVVFLGGLTTAQKNAFKTAANRWSAAMPSA